MSENDTTSNVRKLLEPVDQDDMLWLFRYLPTTEFQQVWGFKGSYSVVLGKRSPIALVTYRSAESQVQPTFLFTAECVRPYHLQLQIHQRSSPFRKPFYHNLVPAYTCQTVSSEAAGAVPQKVESGEVEIELVWRVFFAVDLCSPPPPSLHALSAPTVILTHRASPITWSTFKELCPGTLASQLLPEEWKARFVDFRWFRPNEGSVLQAKDRFSGQNFLFKVYLPQLGMKNEVELFNDLVTKQLAEPARFSAECSFALDRGLVRNGVLFPTEWCSGYWGCIWTLWPDLQPLQWRSPDSFQPQKPGSDFLDQFSSLFQWIWHRKRGLLRTLHLMKGMLTSVTFLHHCGWSHLDVSLTNFLVLRNGISNVLPGDQDDVCAPVPVLIDFGLASNGKRSGEIKGIGQRPYISPELEGTVFLSSDADPNSADDQKADVFSLGVAIFYLVTGNGATFDADLPHSASYNFRQCLIHRDAEGFWRVLQALKAEALNQDSASLLSLTDLRSRSFVFWILAFMVQWRPRDRFPAQTLLRLVECGLHSVGFSSSPCPESLVFTEWVQPLMRTNCFDVELIDFKNVMNSVWRTVHTTTV